MPNITYLIDYKVAAEVLGKAGSLNKLAMMPAGTIQLLGAEKALFKHIKFGSKPPKYGAIFKLQQVGGAARYDRGRIARAYGAKLAIAARADGISKNFIADKLKAQLDEMIKRQSDRASEGRASEQQIPGEGPAGRQGRRRLQEPRRMARKAAGKEAEVIQWQTRCTGPVHRILILTDSTPGTRGLWLAISLP